MGLVSFCPVLLPSLSLSFMTLTVVKGASHFFMDRLLSGRLGFPRDQTLIVPVVRTTYHGRETASRRRRRSHTRGPGVLSGARVMLGYQAGLENEWGEQMYVVVYECVWWGRGGGGPGWPLGSHNLDAWTVPRCRHVRASGLFRRCLGIQRSSLFLGYLFHFVNMLLHLIQIECL